MADLITRLILDNKNFDKNLKMSSLQIKQFKDIANNAIGTLGKFAGAIGIAGGACATFDKLMHSSEVTADLYDGTMRQCTTTVDSFFQALATGDFSAFDEGLVGLINRAKEAYDALDQLENTLISFDRKSSQNQSEFDEKYATAQELKIKIKNAKTQKEKDNLQKQYDDLVADMQQIREDQAGRVGTVTKDTEDAIKKLIREKNPLIDEKDLTRDIYRDIMDMASDKNRDKRKTEAAKYNEIIDKKRREFEAKHTITTTQYDNTMGTLSEVNFTDYEKVNQDLKQWINTRKKSKEFKNAILTTIIYDKELTDKLKEVTELDMLQSAVERTVSAMDRRLNRLNGSATTRTTTSTTTSTTVTPKPNDEIEEYKTDLNTIKGIQEEIKRLEEEKAHAEFSQIPALNEQISRLQTIKKLASEGKLTPEGVSVIDSNGPTLPNFTPVEENNGLNKHLKGKLKTAKLMNNLARSIRGVGDAMRATGNDSKAMARSLAMVNAAASIGMMISIMIEKSKASLGIWDWIAGITAGTATVVAMAAQLRSINTSRFAEGGIVGGNNTIGDMNLVRVNSGEMILNNRQQRNLFSLLNGNGAVGGSASQVEFKIKGKELVGVLDNYNNKMNKVR